MNPSDLSTSQLLDEIAGRLKHRDNKGLRLDHASLENEIQQLSARLREAENCKSHFVSNIRNEVNNPLASIIGLAASIHGVSTEEKVKRMGNLIFQQASVLEFQMRNIIIAAELEAGEVKPCPSRVNVVSLIEEATVQLRHRIEEQQINIQLEAEDHLKFVTDAHLLQTICMNLLANAIEFSGHSKLIVVDVKMKNGLQISVSDFGTGIAPALQTKLFQRFRPGETGTIKAHSGHGLGLSIVKGIVSLLGGSIELQSKVSDGTTITIRIPELMLKTPGAHSDSGNELLFTIDEQF
jgi:signal transduction histidine kinase